MCISTEGKVSLALGLSNAQTGGRGGERRYGAGRGRGRGLMHGEGRRGGLLSGTPSFSRCIQISHTFLSLRHPRGRLCLGSLTSLLPSGATLGVWGDVKTGPGS